MYVGHVALALGARAMRRDLPLWLLVLVAQGCDWAYVLFSFALPHRLAEGWSHAYPGALLAASVLALSVGVWRWSVGAGLLVLALYLSHPLADFVTGYKVFWAGGGRMGLLLVERPSLNFVVQASLVVLCAIGYWSSLPGRRRRGVVLPVALLLLLQASADWVLAHGSADLLRSLRSRGLSARPEAPAPGNVRSPASLPLEQGIARPQGTRRA